MDRRFYVYTITLAGVVRYVGKGSRKRSARHLAIANSTSEPTDFHHNPRLYRAIRKHRATICVATLRANLTEAEAFAIERAMIAEHRRIRDGGTLYNLTLGGEGNAGLIMSAEARARMSEAHSGKAKSPEHRRAMSEARKGKKRPEVSAKLKGRSPSVETRAKLAAFNRGRIATAETRAKLKVARAHRIFTPETCAKISAAKRGKAFTPEHRAALSAARRRNLNQPDLFT